MDKSPNYRVMLISRYKSSEVLSEHRWWLGAMLWAFVFALAWDSADQQVDIWMI